MFQRRIFLNTLLAGAKIFPTEASLNLNIVAADEYDVVTQHKIDSVMEDLKSFPGLFLAGSAYRGIGIPDCIQNGNQAAEATMEFLNGKSP